ncbi:MAG: transposon-transfer assisting family protein [Oscillospiraceae bacterium]|nr:transposon-transfer assisting family protein [Bacillota bacterium]MBR0391716.1 transposon-transfer assisting family protein [Oscillospiraceae bacterium]
MKTRFTKEESILMMLYNPGSREGLIRELAGMKVQLAPEEKRLSRLTDKVIKKLNAMDDATFEGLDLYPE